MNSQPMTQVRLGSNPSDFKRYTSDEIRSQYFMEQVMAPGQITSVYSMHDRMMILGAVPTESKLTLPAYADMTRADFFLQRREMGIINVGAPGTVTVDGEAFHLENRECLYIGMGKKEIHFASDNAAKPAEFYINSCPAHHAYPTRKASLSEANRVALGSRETSNERVIFQYIHENGIQSCQLVMGFTALKPGSVWNTFPPHTHLRRMEVYFYFDLPEDQLVMHFMGEPQETRHVVMRNKQAIISPEWSIHSGAGTSAYAFIWSMAGENKAFTDMDAVNLKMFK